MRRHVLLPPAALALVCVDCGAAERTPRSGLVASDWQGEGMYLVDPATSDRHLIPRTESAAEIAWSPRPFTTTEAPPSESRLAMV